MRNFEKFSENGSKMHQLGAFFAFWGRFSAIFKENRHVHRQGSVTVCYKALHKARVSYTGRSSAGVLDSSEHGPASAQQFLGSAEMRTTITLRAVRYALKAHVTVWVFA
jgi:hypothetical protein